MGIFSARELRPVQGQATLNHFRTQIAAIGKETSRDDPVIREIWLDHGSDYLALAELDQLPFRLFTPRMLKFGRVDTSQAQSDFADPYRVTVDYITLACQGGRGGGCGVDSWARRRWLGRDIWRLGDRCWPALALYQPTPKYCAKYEPKQNAPLSLLLSFHLN